MDDATAAFVGSAANKTYYRLILDMLWPEGHGIPGPHVSQAELREAIDAARQAEGKKPYVDPFRRMRELQGEEGFTSIIKEGVKYQMTSLEVTAKREPRAKPPPKMWERIKAKADFRCSHCGQQEPDVKLSPDHRQPRARGGSNDEENWQPLCEQCNNLKSSACQGCNMNCMTCSWAYPETYKPISIADDNKVQIQRAAEKRGVHQSDLVNQILREHFNSSR
ncbi:MAG: HNH endonuclease [Pelagimonas sp.]|uniref:HNH endonuclease n=1 Tax=Pelagimonas sp. TaxID=2073170 RepID=UPI003D6A2C0E